MTPRIRTDLAQVVQRPPQSPRPTRVARRRMLIGLSALAFVSGCADDGVSSERLREVRLVTYDAYVLPDVPMPSPASKVVLLPSGDAGAMLTKASLNKERPAGDVMFGVDTSLLTRAIDADLFAPLDESVRDLVPDEYRSLGGDSLVPIDVGQVCINADTRWFAEQKLALPQSFDDLILPSYKDLLVVENPAVSSPGLMFLAASVSAIGPSWSEWWQALKENGVKVAADWSEAYEREYTVSGGSYPLMVSYGTSPVAEVDPADTASTPVSAVIESTCVDQVEFAGVLAGAENPAGATALIKHMLSTEFQAEIPASNYVFPIDSKTQIPPVFERFAVRVAEPIRLDPAEVDTNRDEWIDGWRRIFE